MKKILLPLMVLYALHSNAQEAFQREKTLLDFQMGVSNIGAVFGVGAHLAVAPVISVGANFSYQTMEPKEKWFTAYVPEISVDYHFGKRIRTDWYTGTSVGYCFWRTDDATDYGSGCVFTDFSDNHRRNVIWNLHLGFRYFITQSVGLQTQIGVGNVFSGKIGVCFKI